MTMKTVINMPRYSVYKDSDYQWIGNIPEKWNVQKLSSCLFPVSEKNRPSLPLLSITRELGVIERDIEDQDTNHNFIPDDLTNYKLLKKGQFGMNKMKAWQGSYGISNYTGIVSPAYFVFDLTKNIETEFFNWAIRSSLYVSYFGSASDGVRIGQWDLSKTRMKSIPFLIPSKNEQIAIVNFLDQKTAQIDQAISIKQKQIELLKERQQIIIQQAVTKGLDANVPMKDSGIEWIGMIPEHWEIKKLKYVLQLTNKKQLSLNSELLYIGMENIESGTGEFIETNSETEGLANYFEANQLLFGKLRPYLAKVYKTRTIGLCSTEFLVYKCPDNLCIDFYHCFLISPEFIKVINASTYGSKMPRANSDFIGNQMILVPPLKEQIEINQYVNNNKNNIKQLIIIYQQQIEKLKEYKTTLIDSAVTGKIKITPEE